MNTNEPTTFKKQNVVVDHLVDIDLPDSVYRYAGCDADRARQAELYVREIIEILEAHSGVILPSINVRRITGDVCSRCGCLWDTFTVDNGETRCNSCGALVVEEPKTESEQ